MAAEERGHLQVVLGVLREINDTFDVFCQYAGEGAGLREMHRFHRIMPLHADSTIDGRLSRCELWRRYVIEMTRRTGDPAKLAAAEHLTDEHVITLMADRGIVV